VFEAQQSFQTQPTVPQGILTRRGAAAVQLLVNNEPHNAEKHPLHHELPLSPTGRVSLSPGHAHEIGSTGIGELAELIASLKEMIAEQNNIIANQNKIIEDI
jgi:hypothetical protein